MFYFLQECRIVYDDAINQPQIAAMEHVIQHVKQECTTPEWVILTIFQFLLRVIERICNYF